MYHNILSVFTGVSISIIEILIFIELIKKKFLQIKNIPLFKFKCILIKALVYSFLF